MKAIYLTGFMGAGKTTVGNELGKKMGIPVIDSDEVVVTNENRTINEIFHEDGEAYFRQAETQALFSLPTENVIITTGGGIILREENRAFMRKNGTVLFLYCSPEKIFERLKDDDSRPLLTGEKKKLIESRLASRLAFYKEADYIIDTSTLTISETVDKIVMLLTKKM